MRIVNYPAAKRPFDPGKLLVCCLVSFFALKLALELDVADPTRGSSSFVGYVFYNASLLIHEFGHMFFSSGGQFVTYAGGTLMQLLVPLFFVLYFFFSGRFFSSSLTLSWLGLNLVYVSVYMATAIHMEGVYFAPGAGIVSAADAGFVTDWNYMFTRLGLLDHSLLIARLTYYLGIMVIVSGALLGFQCSRSGGGEEGDDF